MNKNEQIVNRLKNVMLADRSMSAESYLRIVRSDLYMLLNNYMVLEKEDLETSLETDETGMFYLTVRAKTPRLIDAGRCVDDVN